MERFKLIKEESYESLHKYLEVLCSVTEIDYPLAFVDLDDRRYFVMKVDKYDKPVNNGYLIMYEENGEIIPRGTFYDGESFMLNTGDLAFKIVNDGVLLENEINLYKQQLLLMETDEAEPKKYFCYHQLDPINGRDVTLNYLDQGHLNPTDILPYLSTKNPKCIDIAQRKLILEHTKRFVLEADRYYRYLRLNREGIMLLSTLRNYDVNSMNQWIESLGFNTTVPREMIELYRGENQEVKTMKRVTDIYKENTKL